MTALFDRYMRTAIQEAHASLREGNHGFGAVIVRQNRVIASAHDTETTAADAVAQGRRRIQISCEEIFRRADARIAVEKGVLKAECSILYDREVVAELKRLRDASGDALRGYDKERTAGRIEWYRGRHWTLQHGDHLERAYRVLLQKLGVQEGHAPVVRRDEKALVFHSKNFCPTLEACGILGLDTRRVCRLSNERSTDALVRQVDPRLRFSRNYENIRPYSEYCEELIGYRKGE